MKQYSQNINPILGQIQVRLKAQSHMVATASELHHNLSPEQHLKIGDAALATKLCSSDAVGAANLAVEAANNLSCSWKSL